MASRIVVMKDGIIQQVASPAELYNYPANMFVAGFIGSPQMNFIEADVVEEDGKILLVFGNQKVALPAEKAEKLDKAYVGQKVVMGIRPEDLYDDAEFIEKSPETVVDTTVTITEMMGAETYLYLELEGKQCVARVKPDSTSKAGDAIKLALDGNKIHIFDKDTEYTVLN